MDFKPEQPVIELERLVAWLEAIHVLLPLDVDKTRYTQTMESLDVKAQLFSRLRDGVGLLKLLSFIEPRAVNKINFNSEQSFAVLDNINRFLVGAESVLEMEELFHPNDLYHKQNFDKVCLRNYYDVAFTYVKKVLKVVNMLALKSEDLQRVPSVFSVPFKKRNSFLDGVRDTIIDRRMIALYSYDATKKDELSFKEGDVLLVLNKVDGGWWEGQLLKTKATGWFPSNYVVASAKEEVPAVLLDASLISMTSPSIISQDDSNFILLRGIFLREMITAEVNFVMSLKSFIEGVVEYLSKPSSQKIMPSFDHVIVFARFYDIVQLHESFIAELEEYAKKSVKNQLVGEVFERFIPKFTKVYSLHCEQYSKSVRVISKYKDVEEFAVLLKEAYSSPKAKSLFFVNPPILNIMTWLVKPSQRLPKYATLIKELWNCTPSDHLDAELLPKVEIKFAEALSQISALRKQSENREVLADLSGRIENWHGPPIESYGELLYDGSLKITKPDKPRDRYFFLLEKAFICLKRTKTDDDEPAYRLLERIPVKKSFMEVTAIPESDGTSNNLFLRFLTHRRVKTRISDCRQRFQGWCRFKN